MLHWHLFNVYSSFLLIQIYHTYLGEPTSVVRKRAISQQLRIHVHYDPDSIPQLPTAFRNIIKVWQLIFWLKHQPVWSM